MKTWIFAVVFFIGLVSKTVFGDYDVTVTLLEYNRDQDRNCDDVILLEPDSVRECDVYFEICLKTTPQTQSQKCYGKNNNQRVSDTNTFVFAESLKSAAFYSWKDIKGQPSFDISVHAFDYDLVGLDDDLGVTTYEYRGNTTTKNLIVTTNPGRSNLRIKLALDVSSGQENVNAPTQKWLHLFIAVTAASLFRL